MIKTLPNPATDLLNRVCSCFRLTLLAATAHTACFHVAKLLLWAFLHYSSFIFVIIWSNLLFLLQGRFQGGRGKRRWRRRRRRRGEHPSAPVEERQGHHGGRHRREDRGGVIGSEEKKEKFILREATTQFSVVRKGIEDRRKGSEIAGLLLATHNEGKITIHREEHPSRVILFSSRRRWTGKKRNAGKKARCFWLWMRMVMRLGGGTEEDLTIRCCRWCSSSVPKPSYYKSKQHHSRVGSRQRSMFVLISMSKMHTIICAKGPY